MSQGQDHTITSRDRTLAQVALATENGTPLPCPSASELALLIDGRVSEDRQEELWHHLASCPTCYEQWRIVAKVQQGVVKKCRFGKIITLGGGLLAAAASIMLFVNIQYSPMPEEVCVDSAPVHERAEEVVIVEPVESMLEQLQSDEQFASRQKVKAKKESRARVKSSRPLVQAMPCEPASQAMMDSMADDPFAVLDQDPPGEIMLDINRLIPTVLQKVNRLSIGQGLEVKTYKRDRGFMLTKRSETKVHIREFGFKEQEMEVEISRLKKTLKTLMKTEFPRSNKVWMRELNPSKNQ
jgi:hypothetical protein